MNNRLHLGVPALAIMISVSVHGIQKTVCNVSPQEKRAIDRWIKRNNLNEYGDAKDIMYMGGTPLFNEQTGETIDRYYYIACLKKYPHGKPWKIATASHAY
jgi:hypothetical protein